MVEAKATYNQGLDVWSDRLETERLLWNDACLAADIFVQLMHNGKFKSAGILVKAQAGPVRDFWLDRLTRSLPESIQVHTVPHTTSPDRLVGGLDLTATLSNGRKVFHQGLLVQANQQAVLLPSADLLHGENLRQILSAHDNCSVNIEREGVSDQQATRFGIIAFDESHDQGNDSPDERVHPGLQDRLTLHIDLNEISIRSAQNLDPCPKVEPTDVSITRQQIEEICTLTVGFGLTSLRPALQTATLANQIALIEGRTAVSESDIQIAMRLGLLNRATQLPASPAPPDEAPTDQEHQPEPPKQVHMPEQAEDRDDQSDQTSGMPNDINLESQASALPPGLLNLLKARLNKRAKSLSGGRRGAGNRNNLRGRPLTSCRGDPGNGRRLDMLATLRSAAPWQKLYGDQSASATSRNTFRVRHSDLHVRQYKQRSETSCIFVVDASGSTAINRLAEAKGAVELLLGASYARRDHVALVSFRGRKAEILLPPTRALVRAKRALAALPGGGGTPLADGLQTALQLAEDEWRKGRLPSLILLTDGSANVDATGHGNRSQAAEDAQKVARLIDASGFETLLIDVGRQQRAQAKSLAANMGAHYVPMPQANANSISDMVKAHRR